MSCFSEHTHKLHVIVNNTTDNPTIGTTATNSTEGHYSGFHHCESCGHFFDGQRCPNFCLPLVPVTAPILKHDWKTKRGPTWFCSLCGENIGMQNVFPACPGYRDRADWHLTIEEWIASTMQYYDLCRPPAVPAVKPDPAWSNVSAAINAVPGWNRRP